MKTETILPADDRQLWRGTPGSRRAAEPRVEELMERDFVSLPAWFSAAQAGKVLRQTGKSYALFGGDRVATLRELEAGGGKGAASCARPFGPAVAVDASWGEAWTVLERHRLDRVAVVLGRVLVGIVTREALVERIPAGRPLRLAA